MASSIQMEIDFQKNRKNSFHDLLDSGTFHVLIEINAPDKKEDFQIAASRMKAMESSISKVDSVPAGFAFMDKMNGWNSWNVADFANELAVTDRDRHVLYVSGKAASLSDIADTIGRAKSSGFQNLIPVTGDSYIPDKTKKKQKLHYVDSVCILNMLKSRDDKYFFPGCTVNPFKYTSSDIFPQYYKLVKKLRTGAGFVTAQCGWDMMKLQELRWYLEMRELHYPSIARFLFLTTEMFEEIYSGKKPGIILSQELRNILINEAKFGYAQFASAQWRRLQIYAAGAKFLGYSGIQIAGIERQEHIASVCTKIAEAMKEFRNFDDWKEAYLSYLSRADMKPYPHRFFMFNNIFTRQYPETANMKPSNIPICGALEKIHYKICRLFFSTAHRHAPTEHLLSKKILTGCKRCSYCRLPFTQFVCPETCPKGLSNGPCGGTRPDGSCEFNSRHQCIHSRIFRLASWQKDFDSLEEKYIKPLEK